MLCRILLSTVAVLSVAASPALAKAPAVVIKVERADAQPDVLGKAPFHGKRPTVDVALLLDTSNSMDGLIHQAKSQLWTIVQQFAKAKKAGQTPLLRVALFEYGNMGLPASEGYIRQVVPLTDDLDKLSESLFGLTTNGGDEYCGQVIDRAVKSLDWSKEPNGYKSIFIAGNEPFTQGTVNYQDACKLAIERGIVVNTIHCGNSEEGQQGQWTDGAKLAEGEAFNIDQDRAVVEIKCPQDEIIIKLNAELNKTYLWYGAANDRAYYFQNQSEQDANAAGLGGSVLAARAAVKATDSYSNRGRDLVDSLSEDETVLEKVKSEDLPESMQKMSADERKEFVAENSKKRADIQRQIAKLSVERESYIAKERERLAWDAGKSTLGDAVVDAVSKQLSAAGFGQDPEN
ncbi:MAG: VWA domain-containing protein [Pirellulales bacterium]